MPKVQHYFLVLLNIADKISYGLLLFIAIGTVFNLNLFSINADNYDEEIRLAYNSSRYLFLYLAILIFLFLIKQKYRQIKYVEAALWIGFCFVAPYLLHQIPSVAQVRDNAAYSDESFNIIRIEYTFYVVLLLLAAVSVWYKGKGKYVLFLLCFLQLSRIYLIPEFKEITALESCGEGKCVQAVNMGIMKPENDHYVYIPRDKRYLNN